jgi:hypothetical protein
MQVNRREFLLEVSLHDPGRSEMKRIGGQREQPRELMKRSEHANAEEANRLREVEAALLSLERKPKKDTPR